MKLDKDHIIDSSGNWRIMIAVWTPRPDVFFTGHLSISDEQVCQWHRMWNDNLVFLADVNRRIVRQRNQIIALGHSDRVRVREQI